MKFRKGFIKSPGFSLKAWCTPEVWKIANKCQKAVSELKLKLSDPHSKPWSISTQNSTKSLSFVHLRKGTELIKISFMASKIREKHSRAPPSANIYEPLSCCGWYVDLQGIRLSRSSCLVGWEMYIWMNCDPGSEQCCKVVSAFRRECLQLGNLGGLGQEHLVFQSRKVKVNRYLLL